MTLDLAFLGFGHVARAFVRQLSEYRERLRDELAIETRIVGAATRRRGCTIDPGGLRAAALASDDAWPGAFTDGVRFVADVVTAVPRSAAAGTLVLVETTLLDIEGGQPAIDHVRAALTSGAHVITANKGPAAFAYDDLASLARRADRSFLFEGAVMDGIPIFNLVRETLPCVRVTGFRGIVNSTTNYMLTEMEGGRSFDEALADMQRQGIAEADPALDVDGWDGASKTAALANVLLDARTTPHGVARQGIREVTRDRLDEARRQGRRLRLIASGVRRGASVEARVGLEEIDERDPLARLTGMQNALVLETDVLGEVAISELTAGLDQTAYALLTDLVTIGRSRHSLPGPSAAPPDRTPSPRAIR